MVMIKACDPHDEDRSEEIERTAGVASLQQGMSLEDNESRYYVWLTRTLKEANELQQRLTSVRELKIQVMGK